MPITKVTVLQKATLSWSKENTLSAIPNGLNLAAPKIMANAKELTKISLLLDFIMEHPKDVETGEQLQNIINVFFGTVKTHITRHEYTKKRRTFTVGMLTITQEDI